jgi:5'-nucleotidase
MVQGSLIDSEYKGISTIEIMNYLAPDARACTLGNHEFDYGLPHLLFLEKMANFPIVNANLYIRKYNKRLMRPHLVLSKAGFDILFTGVITDKVLDSIRQDKLISSFVTLEEASTEVGRITNAYKSDDIDLTILLTHIGYDSDLELARLLKPEWGVDIIIGGHSHTVLEKPTLENNIIIVQAGVGTDQIGRLDVVVDDETNSVVEYKWSLIPIDERLAEPDKQLQDYIASFQLAVDRKYKAVLCKLSQKHTHPQREVETSLGNLVSDAFAETAECDVILLGSGSIRTTEFGPLVTLSDLLACFPYNDILTRYTIGGDKLRQIFTHIMRPENRNGESECYQVNSRMRAVFNDETRQLISLRVDDQEVQDQQPYRVCMQGYHSGNSQKNLNITSDELQASGKTKVVSTSSREVLEEYLRNHQNIARTVEGRLTYQNHQQPPPI